MKINKQLLAMLMLLSTAQAVYAVEPILKTNSKSLTMVNKCTTNALRVDFLLDSMDYKNSTQTFLVPPSTATTVSQATLPTSSGTNINRLRISWFDATATDYAVTSAYRTGSKTKDLPSSLKEHSVDKNGSGNSLYFDIVDQFAQNSNTVAAPVYIYCYADASVLYTQNSSYVNSAGATVAIPSRFLAVWTGDVQADPASTTLPLLDTPTAKQQPLTMLSFNQDGTIKQF